MGFIGLMQIVVGYIICNHLFNNRFSHMAVLLQIADQGYELHHGMVPSMSFTRRMDMGEHAML